MAWNADVFKEIIEAKAKKQRQLLMGFDSGALMEMTKHQQHRANINHNQKLLNGMTSDEKHLKYLKSCVEDLERQLDRAQSNIDLDPPTTGVRQDEKPCDHKYINVGFSTRKMICKFCDRPEGT